MGTFDLARDTRNPFRKSLAKLADCGLFGDADVRWDDGVTFTQEQVTEQINTAVTEAKKNMPSGLEGLGEGVKDHPSITRYKSVEELAKGHLELEKTVGLKGTLIPTENSSDEVKAKFFKDIGRPDLAENYENPNTEGLHDGVKTIGAEGIKAFKDKAFELGLSGAQAKGIMDWHLKLSSDRLTTWDETQKTEKDGAITALRGRWGANYDAKAALVDGLIKKFGNKNLIDNLEESGFGSNPDVIELLANVGAQFSEDQLGELGRSGMGMTAEQAKQEISTVTKQIMDTKQDDPIYKELLKKKDSLYKIAYPSGAPA